jgi:hypothetical protein
MREQHPVSNGTEILCPILFSIGMDGLAFLIYVRDRIAAYATIPILLIWQALVLFYVFRVVLPTYSGMEPTRLEYREAHMHLFRVALILPAVIAIAVWAML